MFRAGVQCYDVMRNGVHVVIGESSGEGWPATVVTGLTSEGAQFERLPAGDAAATIFIPDDIAHVLLDALAAHYGGTGDSRQLRRDYDAERHRVDLMIRSLLKGAVDG